MSRPAPPPLCLVSHLRPDSSDDTCVLLRSVTPARDGPRRATVRRAAPSAEATLLVSWGESVLLDRVVALLGCLHTEPRAASPGAVERRLRGRHEHPVGHVKHAPRTLIRVDRAREARWSSCRCSLWGCPRERELSTASLRSEHSASIAKSVGTRNRRSDSLVSILSPSRELDPPLSFGMRYVPAPDRAEDIAARSSEGRRMFQHEALAEGRYRRVPSRWETEFGRWVGDLGVLQIDSAQLVLRLRNGQRRLAYAVVRSRARSTRLSKGTTGGLVAHSLATTMASFRWSIEARSRRTASRRQTVNATATEAGYRDPALEPLAHDCYIL